MKRFQLRDKKALITGGSDGIGLAIATAFAEAGADIWLVARNADKLTSAAEQLRATNVEVRTSALDLTDSTAVQTLGAEFAQAWDRLDVLVNNAGMARFQEIAEVTDEDLMAQVTLNLLAPYQLIRQFLSHLKTARGNVINISSTSAHRLIPGRPASVYAMTKGGLNSLTKALALELGPDGVRVNAIAPGAIKTPLTRNMIAGFSDQRKADYDKFVKQSFALGRLGEPEDVAQMALHLASSEAKWITGSVFIVDGGLSTN
ncbi:SDR family NAD(P)-dependent oxidoreductase [Aporhodopirellula aestuarii]|uniref:SDR family oxidoreductase n=1 Tax=Aporhodopirellula aestuarii TaxID=2950107 RepID=A0ABT0U377_9BACT|nr:SDR family oxidoreductase [Aporhodopirellula aestuarii]MCM2371051.1 SDR family oxidoreductase [Aporhodopirellula aestuarii]